MVYLWSTICATPCAGCGIIDNMRFRLLILVILTVALAAVAQTSRSVWDGVYTQEQANRGKTAYAEQCATCHGADIGRRR